jgi:hypothetical protein
LEGNEAFEDYLELHPRARLVFIWTFFCLLKFKNRLSPKPLHLHHPQLHLHRPQLHHQCLQLHLHYHRLHPLLRPLFYCRPSLLPRPRRFRPRYQWWFLIYDFIFKFKLFKLDCQRVPFLVNRRACIRNSYTSIGNCYIQWYFTFIVFLKILAFVRLQLHHRPRPLQHHRILQIQAQAPPCLIQSG